VDEDLLLCCSSHDQLFYLKSIRESISVDIYIAITSKPFGALQQAVFKNDC